MRRLLLIGLLLVTSCASKDVVLSPVPPMPEDLTSWSAPTVPELPPLPAVQGPPAEEPLQEPAPPPVAKRNTKARTQVSEALPLFTEGTEYRATVQPGYPLTILLEPGEHPLKVIGGDRPLLAEGEVAPWQVAVTPAEAPRANIFVTVTRPGLRMGLVVATDRRTYLLNLTSVGLTTTRVLRWRYDVSSVVAAPPPAPPGPLPALPFRLHVGYQVQTTQGHQPEWVPRVYDDGMKVYIVFPGTMLFQEAPLLRGIGVNGPYLLNSRQAGRVVIVDQLASRLELRLGIGAQAEVVQVVRGVLETIQCPGHAQCPTW